MHNYTKYFKYQPGYDRFIEALYKKYKSLSKFTGTIKLNNITKEESLVLSKLFGVNYKEKDNITISIKKFMYIMNNSKYEEFDICTLVKEYLNIDLVTNKEEKETNIEKEQLFYRKILNNSNNPGELWLLNVITNHIKPYNIIHKKYLNNSKSLKKELLNILNLINNLPTTNILLSIYSSKYTSDPHYLDLDNNHITLLLYYLSHKSNISYPNTREDKIRLLSKYNIQVDYLSNFIITYNLLSNKEYINSFAYNKEPLILNIKNILSIDYLDTKNKQVFIFENPSILTELLEINKDIAVIISGGFPNTALYLLLDKLVSSNNTLYYNGDLDPEGIIIASKLKEKYPNLVLFCYTNKDYYNGISKKIISNSRLKKISKIKDDDLLEIKELLEKDKYASYQENNKDRIKKYIKEVI